MREECVRQFHNALSSMSKLTKQCALKLEQDYFYFIANDTGVTGPSVWCQMETENFFEDYKLEGVTSDSPYIYLELSPGQMVQSLMLLKNAKDMLKTVKLKLTRKHEQACLSFNIEMASNRQCVHDIPVSPIPRKDWMDYSKPDYEIVSGHFVSLVLPDVKKLKHIVDRYKNLGPYVKFEASQRGQLGLSLLSDRVTLSTHFKELQVVKNPSAINEEAEPVTINIELKKLASALGADHIGSKGCVLHFVREKLLHVSLMTNNVCLDYFLPGVQL